MYALRMEVNAQRIVGITQFRQQTTAVMEQVREGKTLHLIRDSEVIGHVVPANSLVIDSPNVEACLLLPAIAESANRFAQEVMDSGYMGHVGDDIGLIFAWLWNCDPPSAVRWVAEYAHTFTRALREAGYSRPEFRQLWYAMSTGLGVGLRKADIQDFERFTREQIGAWSSELFTSTELAGGERRRERDDPWPDSYEYGGRGYAKRRWCHLEEGQMIPNPDAGRGLPSTNDWCRIETIDGATATLVQVDGNKMSTTIADVATWIPVMNKPPYGWWEGNTAYTRTV